jgi:hypothetical protein
MGKIKQIWIELCVNISNNIVFVTINHWKKANFTGFLDSALKAFSRSSLKLFQLVSHPSV